MKQIVPRTCAQKGRPLYCVEVKGKLYAFLTQAGAMRYANRYHKQQIYPPVYTYSWLDMKKFIKRADAVAASASVPTMEEP